MKINKKYLFIILLAIVLILPVIIPADAMAASSACDFLKNIKTKLLLIAGTVVIIGWIVAGLLYLTSGGSPEKTGLAKKAMIAAIIGTALVILAQSAFTIVNDLLQGPNLGECAFLGINYIV